MNNPDQTDLFSLLWAGEGTLLCRRGVRYSGRHVGDGAERGGAGGDTGGQRLADGMVHAQDVLPLREVRHAERQAAQPVPPVREKVAVISPSQQ